MTNIAARRLDADPRRPTSTRSEADAKTSLDRQGCTREALGRMLGSTDGEDRTGDLTTPMGTAAKFFADAITGKSDAARDYARHLAEALRRDLSGVVASRALYLAGEDDRGRQLVVFAPDLVAGSANNSPFSERKNYTCMDTSADLEQVPEERAARADEAAAASCPSHSARTGFGSADSSMGQDVAGQLLAASRAMDSVEGDAASADAATFTGIADSGSDPHFCEAGQTSLVAGERNVGSAEMENLLLYFVRLMDKVVEREYILLLLCTEGKDDAATGEGWVTWGRFSLLGQMHSLLPRRFKKNLAGLVVFRAAPVLHTFFDFAKLFLCPKFYRKLEFCEEIEELLERFPRGVVEDLPPRVVGDCLSGWKSRSTEGISAQSCESADDPGGGVYTGEDDIPSPVHVVRVFGGGLQVQGDENLTPPPMPPPLLQSVSASVDPSPTANAGARAAAMSRCHGATLDGRFSSSSGTGPNTPSPIQAKSLRITATSGLGPNGPSPSSGDASSTSARQQPARTPGSRPMTLPSAMRKSPSSSFSPGGGTFAASVPYTTGGLGVSPSGSGSVAGYQSRRCGSAPTNSHRRTSNSADFGGGQGMVCSTPGGALSAGRVGPGSGMVGWLSPAEAKSFGNRRSTPTSNPVSPWWASSDHFSPGAGITPREATNSSRARGWQVSPGNGHRNSTPTSTSTQQGASQGMASSSNPGRKGSRARSQSQQYLPTSSEGVSAFSSNDTAAMLSAGGLFGQVERVEGRAAAGQKDREISPRAQRAHPTKSPRHQQATKSPRYQQPTKSPRYMQRTKSPRQVSASKSPRQVQLSKSPRQFQTGKSPRQQGKSPRQPSKGSNRAKANSWESDSVYLKTGNGATSASGKGSNSSEAEARRLLQLNSRQSSSITNNNTRRCPTQEPSVSSRSSCNVIDAVQLAALERAVVDHGARVVNSVVGGGKGTGSASSAGAAASGVGFEGESTDKLSSTVPNSVESVPADHPAPLRRTGANPKTPKNAIRGRSSVGSGGGPEAPIAESDRDGMTTSARIDPGIQALIADYGATACSFALDSSYSGGYGGDYGASQETAAARILASVGVGSGLLGRSGDFGTRGVGVGGNGSSTKGHRVHNRGHDAVSGVRRAVREQKEALRKAAAATVAVSGRDVRPVDGQEEAVRDVGVGSGERRRVQPDPKGKVFGLPLAELMQRTPGQEVPWMLKRFVSYLSKFGLESVGLFRLAGDGEARALLRAALDSGKQVCWDPEEDIDGEEDCLRLTDVNMVAQLLKAFVRELPEPLVPFSAYHDVVGIARVAGRPDARWLQAMRSILRGIPYDNYNCLKFLFGFLREVAAHSATNRMTSENLAIVWAPNLIRPENGEPFAILRDLRFQIETVRWMVDVFDDIFDD